MWASYVYYNTKCWVGSGALGDGGGGLKAGPRAGKGEVAGITDVTSQLSNRAECVSFNISKEVAANSKFINLGH